MGTGQWPPDVADINIFGCKSINELKIIFVVRIEYNSVVLQTYSTFICL